MKWSRRYRQPSAALTSSRRSPSIWLTRARARTSWRSESASAPSRRAAAPVKASGGSSEASVCGVWAMALRPMTTSRSTPRLSAGRTGAFSRAPPSRYQPWARAGCETWTAGKRAGIAIEARTGSALRRVATESRPAPTSSGGSVPPSTKSTLSLVAAEVATSESVLFVEGGTLPPEDVGAGLDYVATRLSDEHVRASMAIPALFPAVHVSQPARAQGWYLDGGARLNAPVRPALSLGVDRLVVIGLNAIAQTPHTLASDEPPDAFTGAAALLEGALADSLLQDVRALARVNQMLGDRRDEVRAADGWRYRRIPFIYVAPALRQEIDQLAERVFAEHYEGRDALRSVDLALLVRLIGGRAGHGALLSYLFFAPEFAAALIELGRSHAQHWLATHTGPDGPWQLDSADPIH